MVFFLFCWVCWLLTTIIKRKLTWEKYFIITFADCCDLSLVSQEQNLTISSEQMYKDTENETGYLYLQSFSN